MKEILLTQGYVALVDDEDYDRVSQFRWCVVVSKPTCLYAKRKGKRPDGSWGCVAMHRFILGTKSEFQVDHIDGDGLNNQRSNLRECVSSQNSWNSRKRSYISTSRFKGVSAAHYRAGEWSAKIVCRGKRIHLGYFKNELDAAKAYNEAALMLFGEFARLNPIQTNGVNP